MTHLQAAVLRWLRYTERRAIISRLNRRLCEMGVVEHSRPAERLLHPNKSWACGVTTRLCRREKNSHRKQKQASITLQEFGLTEPVRELSFRAEKYDLNYTLLRFGNIDRGPSLAEPHVEDTFDRFNGGAS